PAIAADITGDLVPRDVASVPSPPIDDASTTTELPDPERTRVVSLEQYAARSAADPTESDPETRVIHLDSLVAATAARDDDERTRIAHVPDLGDDERTHIVSTHEVDRVTRGREIADDLDFAPRAPAPSPAPARRVPRDFADEPEVDQDTKV